MTEEEKRAVAACEKAEELIGNIPDSNKDVESGWRDLPDNCMPSLETIKLARKADPRTVYRFLISIYALWLIDGRMAVANFWRGFDIDSFDAEVERIMMPPSETN